MGSSAQTVTEMATAPSDVDARMARPSFTLIPKGRLEFLDSLRGLAAISVMFFHFFCGFLPPSTQTSPMVRGLDQTFRYGKYGVQVFFVLSGFVIALTAEASGRAGVPRFLGKRFLRLVPPYWATIALVLLVNALLRTAGRVESGITLGTVLANLTYTQGLFDCPSLQVIFWTLCIEVQFYLLFALALLLGPRCGWWFMVVLFFGALGYRAWGGDSLNWFFAHWHGFFLGILVYHCLRGLSAAYLLMALALVAGVAGWCRGMSEVFIVLTAGAIYLAGRQNAFNRWLNWAPLLWLGAISYSIYLLHGLVGLVAFRRTVAVLGNSLPAVLLAVLVAMGCSLLSAWLFFRLVEAPSTRLAKLLNPKKPQTASAP